MIQRANMQTILRFLRSKAVAVAGIAFGLSGAFGQTCPQDALGTSRTIEIGTAGGLQLGLKSYPQSLALADHEIVLTFDDGPSASTTPKVLDALAKECVKATFFLVGRNALALPALVKREVKERHTVAHHSFSHPAATLRNISESAAQDEILRGIKADEEAAYGDAGSSPRVPFFRFPGFADTPQLVAWLSSRNIAVFGAELWASDWVKMTPEDERALILARLEKENRGILLLHDTKEQTADMLPLLLRDLKARGFKIVHIVPGTAPPPLRAAAEGWVSETEKIIAAVFAKMRRAASPQGAPKEATPAAQPGSQTAPQPRP